MPKLRMTLIALTTLGLAHIAAALTTPAVLAAQDPESRGLDFITTLSIAAKATATSRVVDPYMALAELAELEAVECRQVALAPKVTITCIGYQEPVDEPGRRQGSARERKTGSLAGCASTVVALVEPPARAWIDDWPPGKTGASVALANTCD
jgi:hypothetical protein